MSTPPIRRCRLPSVILILGWTACLLADPAPAGITYLTANTTQGSCTLTAALITCSLGTLAPGQTATITVTARATAVGTHVNTATVTGSARARIGRMASVKSQSQLKVTGDSLPVASATGGAPVPASPGSARTPPRNT